jgi:hypothetical protein
LALVEGGEPFENEWGPVTDAAKAERAAKSKAELSLKQQLKKTVKPVETAIQVNLFAPLPSFRSWSPWGSYLSSVRIPKISSTTWPSINRNKDVQFTELRLYYDKDGVGMDELDLSYNDVDLNPQRLVLATREPELILDKGDLD